MSTLPGETDDELRQWMADWQADPEPAPGVRDDIRRRVKRQSLMLALGTAGEMLLAALMLAMVTLSALIKPAPFNVAAMGMLALMILWAAGCSLWYRRGTWQPSAETTSAFLALSILRCQRRLSALRAGWWLLAMELAVMIPWLYLLLNANPAQQPILRDYAISFGFLAALTGFMVAFLVWGERKARCELRELEAMRRSLG